MPEDFIQADFDRIQAASHARNARIEQLLQASDVQEELKNSKSLRLLIKALNEDAEEAMSEFAVCNPGDRVAVQGLQSRMFNAIYLRKMLAEIIQRGAVASQMLQEQDGIPIE